MRAAGCNLEGVHSGHTVYLCISYDCHDGYRIDTLYFVMEKRFF
jgi:hypothetical protein